MTLHTGLGSFQSVEVEDLSKHRMDSEFYEVTSESVERRQPGADAPERTVTACGTTVVRAVESSISASKTLRAGSGWTDKFIYPVHDFHVTERLLTNFQRPRSPLLMMKAAFAGHGLMMEAYQTAIQEEYRMFSFGDAMLVL